MKHLIFALAIGSSTLPAMAEIPAMTDCEHAVAAMMNLAETNLRNQETLLQLSADKLNLIVTFADATTPEELVALSRFDNTLETATASDPRLMASGIRALRRMCPDDFQQE